MTARYQRSAAAEAAPMHEETIIYQSERNQFCVLNHTAAFLWEQLAQPQTAEELASGMRQVYFDVAGDRALADVRAALDELAALALITAAT